MNNQTSKCTCYDPLTAETIIKLGGHIEHGPECPLIADNTVERYNAMQREMNHQGDVPPLNGLENAVATALGAEITNNI